MNVMKTKQGGQAVLMPDEQKKWSNFPVGAAFPPNGAWKGQPQLVAKSGPNFEASEKNMAAFRDFFNRQGEKPEVKAAVAKTLAELRENRGKWPWLNRKSVAPKYEPFPGEPTV